MRVWLVAIIMLAGCTTGNQLPSAGLFVTYPDGTTQGFDQVIEVDARPSQDLYEQNGTDHPDFYSVHDLLHDLDSAGKMSVTYAFYGAQLGFFPCSIDGQPALEGGQCPADPGAFYEFFVEDTSSDLGISSVPAQGGATYRLVWTPFE